MHCFSFWFLYFCVCNHVLIKCCSNILIIPDITVFVLGFFLFFFLVPLWARPFTACRRMFCLVGESGQVVLCVAFLDGFIYKFVIHYSWNQKWPSGCKQICLPQVSGFMDYRKTASWFQLSYFPVRMRNVFIHFLIAKPDVWSAFDAALSCNQALIYLYTDVTVWQGGSPQSSETTKCWFDLFLS